MASRVVIVLPVLHILCALSRFYDQRTVSNSFLQLTPLTEFPLCQFWRDLNGGDFANRSPDQFSNSGNNLFGYGHTWALAVIERGIPDIESALSAEVATNDAADSVGDGIDTDLEPIEAKAWPDPIEADTVVQSRDADSADDADAEPDTQEVDIDASVTSA